VRPHLHGAQQPRHPARRGRPRVPPMSTPGAFEVPGRPEGCGRLEGKVAVVVGAGQTPGTTIGNGRAAALLFAREGASVLAVDRDLASARETCDLIAAGGGTAVAHRADITSSDDCRSIAET